MRPLFPLGVVLCFLAMAFTPGGVAPPHVPQHRSVTLEAVAYACTTVPDGVCLGYNGVTPGPLIDVNDGDTLSVTLVNRIAETVWALAAPHEVKARLANASVSWHVHGTSVPSTEDGVDAHAGTQLVRSVAPPGGSFTYNVHTIFFGPWHYHDHVLGPDGSEGIERGLFGTLFVRRESTFPANKVFDMHLLNSGVNGGRGFAPVATAGGSFEVVIVGLGDWVWDVEFRNPSGTVLKQLRMGPGESFFLRVNNAPAGSYAWTATNVLGTHSGEVKVQ